MTFCEFCCIIWTLYECNERSAFSFVLIAPDSASHKGSDNETESDDETSDCKEIHLLKNGLENIFRSSFLASAFLWFAMFCHGPVKHYPKTQAWIKVTNNKQHN